MIYIIKKAKIYCECTCGRCGNVIGYYYKNRETISVLKKLTKDWKYCYKWGNLCPKCYEELKIINKRIV